MASRDPDPSSVSITPPPGFPPPFEPLPPIPGAATSAAVPPWLSALRQRIFSFVHRGQKKELSGDVERGEREETPEYLSPHRFPLVFGPAPRASDDLRPHLQEIAAVNQQVRDLRALLNPPARPSILNTIRMNSDDSEPVSLPPSPDPSPVESPPEPVQRATPPPEFVGVWLFEMIPGCRMTTVQTLLGYHLHCGAKAARQFMDLLAAGQSFGLRLPVQSARWLATDLRQAGVRAEAYGDGAAVDTR